jgi:hypothetical protein
MPFSVACLYGQPDRDLRVLASQPQHVLHIGVELVLRHRELWVALVGRQPVHEDVVGEAHLRQAGLDRPLDVRRHLAASMTAASGVDVIVDQVETRRHDDPPASESSPVTSGSSTIPDDN